MEFKSQFYGLGKKLKNARNNGFILNEIVILTIKIDSSLSNINIQYYLKFPLPILHRQILEIISQNLENVKPLCKDLNNPFYCACRKWYLHSQSL